MSFDVFLQGFEEGEPAKRDDRVLQALLMAANARAIEDNHYRVAFPDGAEVDLSASPGPDGAIDGCMLEIRELTPEVSGFVYELALACDFVIMPAHDGPWLLVSTEQEHHLPPSDEAWATAVVESAGDVHAWLRRGYEGWADYREQVAGPP